MYIHQRTGAKGGSTILNHHLSLTYKDLASKTSDDDQKLSGKIVLGGSQATVKNISINNHQAGNSAWDRLTTSSYKEHAPPCERRNGGEWRLAWVTGSAAALTPLQSFRVIRGGVTSTQRVCRRSSCALKFALLKGVTVEFESNVLAQLLERSWHFWNKIDGGGGFKPPHG
uniref:Uncharacterized protein n=1 Tax=Coccidioides posadasii RMSCC 3488 TaxID=454284 RepID=A0A0J6FIX6_COCPO|nr:hypothetical protein CPAG_09400 [Coccidioides posadasii RMSCC 3488]